MSGEGYGLLICAIVFNGTFVVPLKLESVRKMQLNTIVFQFYTSIGVLISSLICFAFVQYNSDFVPGGSNTYYFEPLGLLSGGASILSLTLAFLSAELIGIAIAQGTFSGTAVVSSYLWGVLAFGEVPTNIPLSVFGIIVLCIGVCGIAFCADIADRMFNRGGSKQNDASTETIGATSNPIAASSKLSVESIERGIQMSNDSEPNIENPMKNAHSAEELSESPQHSEKVLGTFVLGITYALICGIFGGSALVPMQYALAANRGFNFLPSFGVGAVITAPIILGVYTLVTQRKSLPPFHVRETMWAGVLAGFVWNINTISILGAISRIGYSIAFPVDQCAIFIGGTWGIFLFKEIKGPAIGVFYAAAAVLIGGAVMLSLSGS